MLPWTIFLFLALLTTPANAQSPMDRLQKLAADGKIDENATVKASSEVTDVVFARISFVRFSRFGRSRPAADATREVVERWLLYGL